MYILTTGDDVSIPCRLRRKYANFLISGGATGAAVITSLDRETTISAQVTINTAAAGTNLAESLIIVEFTKVESSAIQLGGIPFYGEAILEVQLSDPNTKTWSKMILIRKGNIA